MSWTPDVDCVDAKAAFRAIQFAHEVGTKIFIWKGIQAMLLQQLWALTSNLQLLAILPKLQIQLWVCLHPFVFLTFVVREIEWLIF